MIEQKFNNTDILNFIELSKKFLDSPVLDYVDNSENQLMIIQMASTIRYMIREFDFEASNKLSDGIKLASENYKWRFLEEIKKEK